MENGADHTLQNKEGTALHSACLYCRFSTAEMLLRCGANPNITHFQVSRIVLFLAHANYTYAFCCFDFNFFVLKNGDTPLHIACNMTFLRIAELLLHNGADPAIKNNVSVLETLSHIRRAVIIVVSCSVARKDSI